MHDYGYLARVWRHSQGRAAMNVAWCFQPMSHRQDADAASEHALAPHVDRPRL